MFPKADPVAGLVRDHTPNVYAAGVAWYDVAPGVAVFLIGQFLISTFRIWFARMAVSLGLRSRLPAWPLSPTADGPAIVVGEVHHPVRAIESQSPEWLTIPERGLSPGVAMFGAVGSGKTSACLHPFARQLLSWHADNPERRPAALVLEVKGDLCHDIRRMLTELDRGGDYIELVSRACSVRQRRPRPARRPSAFGSGTGRSGVNRAGCVTRRAGAEDGGVVDAPGVRRLSGSVSPRRCCRGNCFRLES